MSGNDMTFEQYLYHNRISPPPEFSGRIDAVCGQLKRRESTASGAGIIRRGKKRRGLHNAAKRVLLAAACLLVVLGITVIAIPSARAAVSDWISGWFSAQDYLGKESESRTAEPALDAVITKVGDDERKIVISDIYDSEEARNLAENFGIRLDEAAYTGDTIYITGWFTGTSGKFLLDSRTGGDTLHEENETTQGDLTLSLSDGTSYSGALEAYFDDEMKQILADCFNEQFGEKAFEYDEDGTLVTTNAKADALWYDWLETHEVRFTCSMVLQSTVPAAAQLSGRVEAGLSFRQYYFNAGGSMVVLFNADLGAVTIDADAYTAVTSTKDGGQSVALCGTHRMFIREWGADGNETCVCSYVSDLDMSGVTISVDSVSFTPTGLDVTLRLDLPESWTREERIAAVQGGETGGLDFIVLIDGQEIRHAFLSIASKGNADTDNKDDPFLTSPREFSNSTLSRSQWDAVKTITFVPCTGWPTELILEDLKNDRSELDRIRLDPGVVVTEQPEVTGTKATDWQEDRMDDFAITIDLDDYR